MDFSKLSSNDKLAAIGAVLAIVGAFFGFGGGGSFGLLTGIVMLVIVFLPQFSPATKLPGSKGSLMVIVGGLAGLGALFALLALFSYGFFLGGYVIGLLLSIVGGLLMGWAAWQEFQSEGGKFNLGTASTPSAPAPPPPPQAAPAPPPPPAAPMSSDQSMAPSQPPSQPMSQDDPMRRPEDEDRTS